MTRVAGPLTARVLCEDPSVSIFGRRGADHRRDQIVPRPDVRVEAERLASVVVDRRYRFREAAGLLLGVHGVVRA